MFIDLIMESDRRPGGPGSALTDGHPAPVTARGRWGYEHPFGEFTHGKPGSAPFSRRRRTRRHCTAASHCRGRPRQRVAPGMAVHGHEERRSVPRGQPTSHHPTCVRLRDRDPGRQERHHRVAGLLVGRVLRWQARRRRRAASSAASRALRMAGPRPSCSSLQRVAHLVQRATHDLGRDREALLAERARHLGGGLARPAHADIGSPRVEGWTSTSGTRRAPAGSRRPARCAHRGAAHAGRARFLDGCREPPRASCWCPSPMPRPPALARRARTPRPTAPHPQRPARGHPARG